MSSFTSQHYIALASTIRKLIDEQQRGRPQHYTITLAAIRHVAYTLAVQLQADNIERFDYQLFWVACGIPPSEYRTAGQVAEKLERALEDDEPFAQPYQYSERPFAPEDEV